MPSITDFLTQVAQGVTHPKGNMADFQHASNLYVDDVYALTPKNSWIYYVSFNINRAAISEVMWAEQRRDAEAGMLVKSADLPKFAIDTEVMNQYNKKTVVQKKINYQPISMSFHDDMSNVTNSLWVNYFRYYYRDTWWGTQVGGLTANPTRPLGYQNTKYETDNIEGGKGTDQRQGIHGAYGLNNNQSVPFFNSITIYQLNQKRFTSYSIINPLIQSWEHDQLDQNQTKMATNRMTLQYETVFYGEGAVFKDINPPGFATFHYDRAPSPLSIFGGGTASLFGPGGLVQGTQDIFGATNNLLSGGTAANPLAAVGIFSAGTNLVRNARNITSAGLKQEGQSLLNSALKGAVSSGGGIGGMLGGGLGSLSKSLGFGPRTGTMLVGTNFNPNWVEATPSDVAKSGTESAPPTGKP